MSSLRILRTRRPYSRRLLLPLLYANLTTVLLAGRYGQLTLGEQLGESFPLFLLLMGVFSLLALAVEVVLCLRRLRVLRGLEAAAGPVEPERLGQAVMEVHLLADFAFYSTLVLWIVASVLGNVAMWVASPSMSLLLALRMVWPGLLFGPLSALLTYGLITMRARAVALDMGSLGLTPVQAIAAAPRRSQIRPRLVIFTAIVVVTPAALIWDVSVALADRAFERLMETSPERQAELVDMLRFEALRSGGALCLLIFGVAMAAAYLGGTILGRPMRQLGRGGPPHRRGRHEPPAHHPRRG